MKNTLIINLFGDAGVDKSTASAYIFAQLKMMGIDCVYINEFGKDKILEDNQLYITIKQSFKISKVFGEVDIIINDCPILMSVANVDESKKYLRSAIVEEFMSYGDNNLNILLKRVVDYDPNGRNQTEDEAREIDNKIKDLFSLTDIVSDYESIPYIEVDGSLEGCNQILELILKVMEYMKNENT